MLDFEFRSDLGTLGGGGENRKSRKPEILGNPSSGEVVIKLDGENKHKL